MKLFDLSGLKAIILAFFTLFFLSLSLPVLALGIYPSGQTGHDLSFVNCSSSYSALGGSFGIIGVTGGRAFSSNPCLQSEAAWASGLPSPLSLYMNLNSPIGTTSSKGMTGPAGNCAKKDKVCQAYNYGYNAAVEAYNYATSNSVSANTWWLDIETGNSWSANASLTQKTIQGAADFFTQNSISIGIYSTPSMWNTITSGYQIGLPEWLATNLSSASAASLMCSSTSFTGGQIALVQYIDGSGFDADYACP